MGASPFFSKAKGATSEVAFDAAVSEAQYLRGHGGYTGTIAEKTSFTEIEVPAGVEPGDFAVQLVNAGDVRVDDKWGPAGAVKCADGDWLFFGWASC